MKMDRYWGRTFFLLMCSIFLLSCDGESELPGKGNNVQEEEKEELDKPVLVDIPDAEFKKLLVLEKLWVMTDIGFWLQSDRSVDSDGDGEISEAEALKIRYLEVDTWHIRSLEGIKKMTNLEVLKCKGHFVEREDMTWNIYESKLELLDVSGMPKLKRVDCEFNVNKKSKSAVQMNNCPSLEAVHFESNTFSEVNATSCPALKELHYTSEEAPLLALDVNGCGALEKIICIESGLQQLNVGKCIALQTIECPWNDLKELDVTDCKELNWLNCEKNKLSKLDISYLPDLTTLLIDYNNLSTLDVSNNTKLERLNCTQGSVEGANTLSTLYVNEHQLNSVPEKWKLPEGVKLEQSK